MSVIIDGSAGVTTNAGGSVNPSTNIDGINFSCRAFVNFDGTKDTTGATSTANTNRLIRASGNVSSVLRNGLGDYTVNFTTAMPDANYAPTFGAQADQLSITNNGNVYGEIQRFTNALQTTSARLSWGVGGSTSRYDPTMATVAIFR